MRLGRLFDRQLFTDVDGSTLAVFRVAFGLVMAFWAVEMIARGRVDAMFLQSRLYFTYPGFSWVVPLPGSWMYVFFGVLGLSALGMALGLFYRLSALVFSTLFIWFFLIDKTNYQNHYYLLTLLGPILALVPAHRELSLDARRKPGLRSRAVPGWALFLVRFQLAVPYVFGALAKINSDWLRGQPMRVALERRADLYPALASLFQWKGSAYFVSWTGLLFDLLIVPGLMFRRTRKLAVAALLCFHLTNSLLFTIDIFPYLMLAATIVFFEPGWARRNRVLGRLFGDPSPAAATRREPDLRVTALVTAYAAIQILVPLRVYAIPGNVSWHEVGHYFSWHMMLRDKSGETIFLVTDPATEKTWEVNPREYLTERQYSRMRRRPDMIWQFSQYLAERLSRGRAQRVEVRVGSYISLNGRKPQLMINPMVDLATATDDPFAWVLPLTEPLPE